MRGRKWNELEKQGQKKYVCVCFAIVCIQFKTSIYLKIYFCVC